LNLAVFALATMGWLAAHRLPSARHCLRINPKGSA